LPASLAPCQRQRTCWGLAAYIRHHRIEILHSTDRPRDAITCVLLAALTGAEAGYRPDRVHAVLNAIEPSRWDPSLDPAPGRASLGVPDGAPLIVSVARLFRWKGHFELLGALALVKLKYPNVRLAVVGSDYPADSGATQMLREHARKLGIEENVVFTGQRSDVAVLLAACDVFSLPSFEEPFGLVSAEAMAMKR
jgi:glycosyltransferase involved in cell wall biosynthesis